MGIEIELPCLKCPVLAICVAKKMIECPLLLKFLTEYQRIARFPMWGDMLNHVRKTLRGNWCIVGYNGDIVFLEKDRGSKAQNFDNTKGTYRTIT